MIRELPRGSRIIKIKHSAQGETLTWKDQDRWGSRGSISIGFFRWLFYSRNQSSRGTLERISTRRAITCRTTIYVICAWRMYRQ